MISTTVSVTMLAMYLTGYNAVYADIDGISMDDGSTEEVVDPEGKENAVLYAENIYRDMLGMVMADQDSFGTEIENENDIILGEAFIIYDELREVQEASYYLPLYDGDEVVLTMNVLQSENGWSASLGTEMVDELNQVEYKANGGVAYYTQDEIVMENSTGSIELMKETEDAPSNRGEFALLPYAEKEEIVEDSDDQVELIDTDNERGAIGETGYSPSVLLNDRYAYLYTQDCYVSQGSYNLCWAASIATIYRYRTGNRTKTAINVADDINHDYSSANDTDIEKAFMKEKLLYRRRLFLTYDAIKKNIRGKWPVMLIGRIPTTNTKHAVTIIGYNESNSTELVQVWDSASENKKILTYGEGNAFKTNNVTYTMIYEFSYK